MKKQTKGIIFTILFGGGLLFWATAASMPGVGPAPMEDQLTITGTPADNFPDDQRPRFCSSGEAKSGRYVQEYRIPTECTQPLAIATDSQGRVWFAQTNTGMVAEFDPDTETFTEYENPAWPQGQRSMMWGMDYSPDGSIWYTDEVHDRVWRFSTLDGQYTSTSYPSEGESLPQRLKIAGSDIIVNDFTGGKITLLDPAQTGEDVAYTSIPAPIEEAVTGDFAIDGQNNLWYTNWIFQSGGVLVRLDQDGYVPDDELGSHVSVYQFPPEMSTPNGVEVGPHGTVWIADTSSSYFFGFDPESEEFTTYVTSDPPQSSFGNASGLIKAPVSRPYWIESDDFGRLVFNEQTANRIGLFDPAEQTLVEYLIPSKNPDWADCIGMDDCGLAQVFGLAPDGERVWFTQWVENNIGVLDTSVPLPFSVDADAQEITVERGETVQIEMTILAHEETGAEFVTSNTAQFSDLVVLPDTAVFGLDQDGERTVTVSVTASMSALQTSHKVLIGAQTDEVTISRYVTVDVV